MALPGNDAVITALETLLMKARQGRAGYLFAAMLTDGERPTGGWFGDPRLEPSAMIGVEELAAMWNQGVLNRVLPERDINVSADRVCFNAASTLAPFNFDFLTWLIDQEMTRRRENAPAPLKVHFWMGHDGTGNFSVPVRKEMFENVVRPALALIGAVEDASAADGRVKETYVSCDIVAASLAGEEVPKFAAPQTARDQMRLLLHGDDRPPVTITLREAKSFTERNSTVAAWLELAQYLRDQGERVIFLRDTIKAREPIDGFATLPAASINLHLRAALYEQAKANLFVANGPVTIALYGDRPWLCFVPIEPDGHDYAPNTPSFWREHFGIQVGEQFPWQSREQRIVWTNDDYDNLRLAWDQLASRINRVAQAA